jgi:predicted nucleic acid-binding protein
MKNSDININLNQPSGEPKASVIAKTFKGIADAIADASWRRLVKVFIVMFFFLATILGGFFAYNIANDKEAMHEAAMKMARSEKEENIREVVVTPKIQHELSVLVYTLNADRAFIFELHNGKKNTSGLPFKYADMTYEVTNEEKKVDKVAIQFQDIPLTLYKYPHYLQTKKIIIGTTDEISGVDEDYANHIRAIGGKYLGMIYMSSGGTPIGFLCVSYHNLEDVPNKNALELKLKEYGKMFTQLLDLRVQMELN